MGISYGQESRRVWRCHGDTCEGLSNSRTPHQVLHLALEPLSGRSTRSCALARIREAASFGTAVGSAQASYSGDFQAPHRRI